MLPQEIIGRKRDGHVLTGGEISAFIKGLTEGDIGDAQVAAFAMAVLLKGMDLGERVALTEAMRDSGEVLSWDLPGPIIDKHSTGGVGDLVSLVLAPALAACGAYVPMISGRGLGHTGGTLDKLDAIPGYRSAPDLAALRSTTRDVGCAIVGQTATLAPADRRLYAIRDVSATVESIDLICGSILSKKLAAGIETLVLDVKSGSGAFMGTYEAAQSLARALCEVAAGAGCKARALITDMNEPLAGAAGNALEIRAAIDLLTGQEIDGRLWDVTVALGGAALSAGMGLAPEAAEQKIRDVLGSGAAAERFSMMVAALGGPADILERPEAHLDQAPVIREIELEGEGFIHSIDTRALGLAVVDLGGGRRAAGDTIDYAVGLDWILGLGLAAGAEPFCRVHARREEDADRAEARIRAAITLSPSVPAPTPLILGQVQ